MACTADIIKMGNLDLEMKALLKHHKTQVVGEKKFQGVELKDFKEELQTRSHGNLMCRRYIGTRKRRLG